MSEFSIEVIAMKWFTFVANFRNKTLFKRHLVEINSICLKIQFIVAKVFFFLNLHRSACWCVTEDFRFFWHKFKLKAMFPFKKVCLVKGKTSIQVFYAQKHPFKPLKPIYWETRHLFLKHANFWLQVAKTGWNSCFGHFLAFSLSFREVLKNFEGHLKVWHTVNHLHWIKPL